MKTTLLAVALLATAAPAMAQQATPSRPAAQAPAVSQTISGLRNGMQVFSSDGVRVAETAHILKEGVYEGTHSFFTEAPYMSLKRIYPKEAYVEGDTVRLRMTAAEYGRREQNPPDQDNGRGPGR